MRRQSIGLFNLLMLAALAGCRAGGGDGSSGEVIVDGSSTVYRISKAAQEAYGKVNPDVLVVVDNHGTGGGFGRYLEGEVDIVDASRPAKPEEESRAKAQGIEWTRFLVGYDGITVVVHHRNDFVKSLSVAQLKQLWEPDSTVKTWKDLDPAWPDRKIVLYSPDHDSGTYEFFVDAIVAKSPSHNSAPAQAGELAKSSLVVGPKGKGQRKDVQVSADDNTLVTGVAGDTDGLGYFGYAYYAANAGKLRAIAIQEGPDAQPIAPSPTSILDKSYSPLSRPLFLYAKKSALRRPEVAGFLRFYLDNVKTLAETGGYVSPTAADIAANRAAWPPLEPARRAAE